MHSNSCSLDPIDVSSTVFPSKYEQYSKFQNEFYLAQFKDGEKKKKEAWAVVGVLENDFKRGGSPRFVLRWNNALKQVEEEEIVTQMQMLRIVYDRQ